MRKIFVILFLLISVSLAGTTYYVSTTGNDGNPGTLAQPFATWQKLSGIMSGGDIAYIRGGTYRSTLGAAATVVCRWQDMHGTVDDTIKIYNYPGEYPVLNLDDITMTAPYCYIVFVNRCSYMHIKGLRITGLAQQAHSPSIFGLRVSGSPHITIERVEIDHLGMYGFAVENGSDYCTYINCDAHHLADNYSGYGGPMVL